MRATAAVFYGTTRKGSAVLVDGRYLLTAGHVLRDQHQPIDAVEVVFPAVTPPGGAEARLPARRVAASPGSQRPDAAVLDLGEHPQHRLPAPIPLSPKRRLPPSVSVFGFPKADALDGMWRLFTTAGPTTSGKVQIDWAQRVGTLPGHSGGPVLDPASNTVVGVLVEGSETGKFDRFVPVGQLAEAWPQLHRPWLLTGADGVPATAHFRRRAYGQRGEARSADLFRGRQAARSAVCQWLTGQDSLALPLVITGQPGAGKSSVIRLDALEHPDVPWIRPLPVSVAERLGSSGQVPSGRISRDQRDGTV